MEASTKYYQTIDDLGTAMEEVISRQILAILLEKAGSQEQAKSILMSVMDKLKKWQCRFGGKKYWNTMNINLNQEIREKS